MGVSRDRGTPKWMVYFMENPVGMYKLYKSKPSKWISILQGGPLLVINGVINPINGLIIG